jgi:hypothetical protein
VLPVGSQINEDTGTVTITAAANVSVTGNKIEITNW